MKKLAMTLVSSAVLLAMILLAVPSYADSPLPPPSRQTIWSANRRFFAVMDPDQHITTIYRATQGKQGDKVWAVYGWFRVAELADDGDHLVAGYVGGGLLPIDYDKQQVMLYFFKRGELINDITLDRLIQNNINLQKTVSHYHWGDYCGFDQAGNYVIETVENRRIRFDVTTGKAILEGRDRNPPGKSLTPNP